MHGAKQSTNSQVITLLEEFLLITVLDPDLEIRDWSKSIGGGGWTGAFGNVVDKKHMTHPLPAAQK